MTTEHRKDDERTEYVAASCPECIVKIWSDRDKDWGGMISLILLSTRHRMCECWRCRVQRAWMAWRGNDETFVDFLNRDEAMAFWHAFGRAVQRVFPE